MTVIQAAISESQKTISCILANTVTLQGEGLDRMMMPSGDDWALIKVANNEAGTERLSICSDMALGYPSREPFNPPALWAR